MNNLKSGDTCLIIGAVPKYQYLVGTTCTLIEFIPAETLDEKNNNIYLSDSWRVDFHSAKQIGITKAAWLMPLYKDDESESINEKILLGAES